MFINCALLVAFIAGPSVYSWPTGAPTSQPGVCKKLLPHHGGFAPSPLPVPYTIVMETSTIEPKGRIRFVLGSPNSRKFRGFLIVARRATVFGDTEPQGMFHLTSNLKTTKVTDCGSARQSAVTHKSAEEKTEIHVDWEAPEAEGDYNFIVTIVEKFNKFWVELPSPTVTVRRAHNVAAPVTLMDSQHLIQHQSHVYFLSSPH